ncbi:MAG TPA: hypothetical protein VNJ04_04620 [Gemmatimonadaceae bacterium]|nr:hypothetical protein [Gemmatimonadaceae bacterium]
MTVKHDPNRANRKVAAPPKLTTHEERVNWLLRAAKGGGGDTSWVDDLPEADELPDDEDDTLVEIHAAPSGFDGPSAARRFEDTLVHVLGVPKNELVKREAAYQASRRAKKRRAARPSAR